MPVPPYSSGMMLPRKPASAKASHISWGNFFSTMTWWINSSLRLAKEARMSLAVSRTSFCSSEREKSSAIRASWAG